MNNAKSITNATTGSLTIIGLLPPRPGSICRRNYTMAAGATIDLSTIVERDESEKCESLDAAIAAATVTVNSSYAGASEDAEIAALQTEVDGLANGTNAASFTVDADSTTGKVRVTAAAGAANKTLVLTNAALTDDRTQTFQDVTGVVALVADIAVDANLSAAAQAVVTAGACDVDANLSAAAQAVITAGACDVDANLSAAAQAAIAATHTQGTDAGTTGAAFTVDSDAATGKIKIEVVAGAADKTLTLTNAALTDDRTVTLQDVTGVVALVADIATDANLSAAAQAVITAGACDVDANLSAAAQAAITASHAQYSDLGKILTYESAASVGGGGATETLAVVGLEATDTIICVHNSTAGATPANSVVAGHGAPGAGSISVTWIGDPGAGAKVTVAVKKA